MIKEKRRWMTYTYFNRNPGANICTTHLFAFGMKPEFMMICVPFPTITVDLSEKDFVSAWSASTRTKINKAGQDALNIERGKEWLTQVLQLFMLTARRKGLNGYKDEDFSGFSTIEVSATFKNGLLLCGHVWIIDREEARALLYVNATQHGRDSEEASVIGRAHYHLLWQDGLMLQQKGIKTMDLMGFDPDTKDLNLSGVYQWKAGTHGTSEILYHYYPIWFYVLRKFRNMLTR